MPRLLFVCTGNYYRSRFAEELFNHLARERGLPWTAFSRGLQTWLITNPGTGLSPHTAAELKKRGIPVQPRLPVQISEACVTTADRAIFLKEAEHRPLFENQFPHLKARAEYWHVHDLDQAEPHEALPQIAKLVHRLIDELS